MKWNLKNASKAYFVLEKFDSKRRDTLSRCSESYGKTYILRFHNPIVMIYEIVSSLPRSFFSSIMGALIGYVASKFSDIKTSLEVLLKPEILKRKNVYLSILKKAIKNFRIKFIGL